MNSCQLTSSTARPLTLEPRVLRLAGVYFSATNVPRPYDSDDQQRSRSSRRGPPMFVIGHPVLGAMYLSSGSLAPA